MTRERPLVILICLGILSMPLGYHECIYYRCMTFSPKPTTNLANGSHVRNFLPHALAFTIIKNIIYLCFTAQWAFVDCYWQCFTPPMCGLVLEPGDSAGHCALQFEGCCEKRSGAERGEGIDCSLLMLKALPTRWDYSVLHPAHQWWPGESWNKSGRSWHARVVGYIVWRKCRGQRAWSCLAGQRTWWPSAARSTWIPSMRRLRRQQQRRLQPGRQRWPTRRWIRRRNPRQRYCPWAARKSVILRRWSYLLPRPVLLCRRRRRRRQSDRPTVCTALWWLARPRRRAYRKRATAASRNRKEKPVCLNT